MHNQDKLYTGLLDQIGKVGEREPLLDEPGAPRGGRRRDPFDDVDGLLWKQIQLSDQLLRARRLKPRSRRKVKEFARRKARWLTASPRRSSTNCSRQETAQGKRISQQNEFNNGSSTTLQKQSNGKQMNRM
nr:hypothetical protein Iba_chr09bCG5690 [Ipomoea batatas]